MKNKINKFNQINKVNLIFFPPQTNKKIMKINNKYKNKF